MLDTSPKSWVFNCHDFSDGEVNLVQCAIKFKTQEIADEFRDAFTKAKELHVAAAGAEVGEKKVATSDNVASGGTDMDDLAAIDEQAASYHDKQEKRRGSLKAQSALADSDYDSNEEDVDEGNEATLRAKYGIVKDEDVATTESLTDAMAKTNLKEWVL